MQVKNCFKKLLLLLFLMITLLAGCDTLRVELLKANNSRLMEKFAEVRYEKAVRYMEESRLELAQEQFAIVAATAVTPELRARAMNGYAKADRAISVKR